MGVERGNAVGWDSPGSLQLLPYSSPHLCLECKDLKPPGSMTTPVPQSAFSTQAATVAKSWQVSIPWQGHGGKQMGQVPTSSTSAPDLQDQIFSSHRDSLSRQKPAEKEKGTQRWELYTLQPKGRGGLKAGGPLCIRAAVLPQGAGRETCSGAGNSPHLLI